MEQHSTVVLRKRRTPAARTPANTSDMQLAPPQSPLSQLEELQRLWDSIGVGANGLLTLDELGIVCGHIGLNMRRQELEDLYSKLDADGDGTVSLKEFYSGLLRFVPSSEIQERPRSFLYVPDVAKRMPNKVERADADNEFDVTVTVTVTDTTHLEYDTDGDGTETDRDRSASSGSASSGVVTVDHGAADARNHSRSRTDWRTQTLPSRFKRSNSLQHDRTLCLFPHSQTVTDHMHDVTYTDAERGEESALQRPADVWHSSRSLSGSARTTTTRLFTGLPTDASGCVRVQKLLKYLHSVDFHDGERLLQVLRIAQMDAQQQVHVDTLTERIEETFANFLANNLLLPARPGSKDRTARMLDAAAISLDERLLVQAALTIYRSEMLAARAAGEQWMDRTSKLQTELDEANRRMVSLIKESEERIKEAEKSKEHEFTMLSEQHRVLMKQQERKYQLERNELLVQLDAKRCQLDQDSQTWRDTEIVFRHTITDRDKYIKAIELQLSLLQTKYDELTTSNTKFQSDIDRLTKQLLERQVETKATFTREKELLEKLAALEKANLILQDKNDELASKIEDLKKMTKARSFTKLNKPRGKTAKNEAPKLKAAREDGQSHFGSRAGSSGLSIGGMRPSGSLFFSRKKRTQNNSTNRASMIAGESYDLPTDNGCSAFTSESTICDSSSTQCVNEHSLLQSLTQITRRDTDDEAESCQQDRERGMFLGKFAGTHSSPLRAHASETRSSENGSQSLCLSQASLSTVCADDSFNQAAGIQAVSRPVAIDSNTSTSDIPTRTQCRTVDVAQQCDLVTDVRSTYITEWRGVTKVALDHDLDHEADSFSKELQQLRVKQQTLTRENELLKADLAETRRRETQSEQALIMQHQHQLARTEISVKQQIELQMETMRQAHADELERMRREHRAQVASFERHLEERENTRQTSAPTHGDDVPQQINKFPESECVPSKLSLLETSHSVVFSNPECRLVQCTQSPTTLAKRQSDNEDASKSFKGGAALCEVTLAATRTAETCDIAATAPNGSKSSWYSQNVTLQPSRVCTVALNVDRPTGHKVFPSQEGELTLTHKQTQLNEPVELRKVEEKLRASSCEKATGTADRHSKQSKRSSKRASTKSSTNSKETVSLLILNQHIEIRNQICPHGCEPDGPCRDCQTLDSVSSRSSSKKRAEKAIGSRDAAARSATAERDRSPARSCTSCWSFC